MQNDKKKKNTSRQIARASLEPAISSIKIRNQQSLNSSYITLYMQLHKAHRLEHTPTQFYKGGGHN
jgi:hypothetical protein